MVTGQAGEEIARHLVLPTKGTTVIEQRHYAGLRTGLSASKWRVIEVVLGWVPEQGQVVGDVYR